MSTPWYQKLSDLFAALGQDPIEDAPSLMDVTGTDDERRQWLDAIAEGIAASQAGDDIVVSIINRSGYRIAQPAEAINYLEELRSLYLKEINSLMDESPMVVIGVIACK